MKRGNASRSWAMASLLVMPTLPLLAADNFKLEPPVRPDKNRFGVSYRMGFNVTAEFKNVGNVGSGGASGRGPGPATGSGIDRIYDDGYNRVDVSGNQGNRTWFWGYRNASQVTGEDTLEMHSTTAAPISSKTYDNDPQHGFELTYNRELGRAKNGKFAWGVEGGFGWTDIDIRDSRALAGGTRQITDAFNLGGVDPSHNIIAPGSSTPAPYNDGVSDLFPGTSGGPGALIDDAPSSRTITRDSSGSVVRGERAFDADLFAFRVGPYIEVPLDARWTISLSAGAAMGVIDGEFRFDQSVATVGGTTRQIGRGSDTDVLFGGYLNATIHYQINESWGVAVGGQYLGLADCYEARARGQAIRLDFARTAFFTAGVTYTF